MSVPPESIAVGRCYLMNNGQVRRVLGTLPGRILFERRVNNVRGPQWSWVPGMSGARPFAQLIEREVPPDWTPAMDEKP